MKYKRSAHSSGDYAHPVRAHDAYRDGGAGRVSSISRGRKGRQGPATAIGPGATNMSRMVTPQSLAHMHRHL